MEREGRILPKLLSSLKGDVVHEAPTKVGFGEDKVYALLPLFLERVFPGLELCTTGLLTTSLTIGRQPAL